MLGIATRTRTDSLWRVKSCIASAGIRPRVSRETPTLRSSSSRRHLMATRWISFEPENGSQLVPTSINAGRLDLRAFRSNSLPSNAGSWGLGAAKGCCRALYLQCMHPQGQDSRRFRLYSSPWQLFLIRLKTGLLDCSMIKTPYKFRAVLVSFFLVVTSSFVNGLETELEYTRKVHKPVKTETPSSFQPENLSPRPRSCLCRPRPSPGHSSSPWRRDSRRVQLLGRVPCLPRNAFSRRLIPRREMDGRGCQDTTLHSTVSLDARKLK